MTKRTLCAETLLAIALLAAVVVIGIVAITIFDGLDAGYELHVAAAVVLAFVLSALAGVLLLDWKL